MFAQVAMRVVELSKSERLDSKPHSYTSYTSSRLMASHMSNTIDEEEVEVKQQKKLSNPTSPNIKIGDDNTKKKGWCCWNT